jgi:hypothetical protein
MKGTDRWKIFAGLAVFLALVALPFWYGGWDGPAPVLDLDTPAIRQLPERKCGEATPFMRANHMTLLADWRRIYVALDGREIEMSLSRTCLRCHSDKTRFCDRCHDDAGVSPACWDCHVVPEAQRESPTVTRTQRGEQGDRAPVSR